MSLPTRIFLFIKDTQTGRKKIMKTHSTRETLQEWVYSKVQYTLKRVLLRGRANTVQSYQRRESQPVHLYSSPCTQPFPSPPHVPSPRIHNTNEIGRRQVEQQQSVQESVHPARAAAWPALASCLVQFHYGLPRFDTADARCVDAARPLRRGSSGEFRYAVWRFVLTGMCGR